MLKTEEQMELVILQKHGESIRGLSRSTGRSRNTVRRYLRGGFDAAARKAAPKRGEKLDPFKSYIAERLKAAEPERIPATVLFCEIRERGYAGGETRVRQFMRRLRPAPAPEAVIRFETEPGHQMQADWASAGHGAGKLSIFIATLGWSRAAYVEFCDDERAETLIECHEHAFLAFAGVPREVLFDNMKTVVIERNRYGRGAHRFHPGFLDYARHVGFLPRLCQPYRAQTKGKVERFIGYLKRSFWVPFAASMRQAGLSPGKHAANAAAARWLREVANARIHATAGEVPAERLLIEAGKLKALAAPYSGRSARSLLETRSAKRVAGYQHPLSVYPGPGGRGSGMSNLQHERIEALAQELRLTALPDLYGPIAQNAAKRKDASYAGFLEEVLKAEREARRARSRDVLTRTAGFPAIKTLDIYDFAFAAGAPRQQIKELASLSFVERAGNVVLLGPSEPREPCASPYARDPHRPQPPGDLGGVTYLANPGCKRECGGALNSWRKLGGHHLPSVEATAVDDESPVANRVNRALLLTRGIHIGRNRLQHDNVALINQIDDFALDVGEALLDQGGVDELAGHGRELELSELVGIGT